MPPEAAESAAPRPVLRLVPEPRLRVVDVALFYGERSGGIRTYLDAKRAWARRCRQIDHHVITPHDVPSFRFATPNGYRLPVGVGALRERLLALEPDVVLLHDPFWSPLGVTLAAHEAGARAVAVHHGSVALDAAGVQAPGWLVRPALRAWFRHAYRDVDAVMSVVPTLDDTGRDESIPLRFGLEDAFHPRPDVERGDHVLYVGRFAREKGVLELLDATAGSGERWPLRLIGSGPLERELRARARRHGIAARVSFEPFLAGRVELARAYAAARVVVMPGAHETFGLVGFEAAASGARVVCCETAPSRAAIGRLAHTFRAGSTAGLSRAIFAARRAAVDHDAAWRLVQRHRWPAALSAEHRDLLALLGR